MLSILDLLSIFFVAIHFVFWPLLRFGKDPLNRNQCWGIGSAGSICFGPLGSGSISQRYGSGSVPFKTEDDFPVGNLGKLSEKNMKKLIFCILKVTVEKNQIRIRGRIH
jgi:hypothetical protein